MFDSFDWSELQNWNEYTKIFIGVFARVSPPFIVPLYLNIAGDRSFNEKIGVALIGAATFAVTMVFFTFYGQAMLNAFGITMAAFRIAGGFVLFMLALDMVRSGSSDVGPAKAPDESWPLLGIVPLGIPILAGPGSITTIIIFSDMHDGPSHKLLVTGVLLLITVYIAVMLCIAAATKNLFGPLLSKVFNRLMGLIVLAIAVEFILDGFAAHFPELQTVH